MSLELCLEHRFCVCFPGNVGSAIRSSVRTSRSSLRGSRRLATSLHARLTLPGLAGVLTD